MTEEECPGCRALRRIIDRLINGDPGWIPEREPLRHCRPWPVRERRPQPR